MKNNNLDLNEWAFIIGTGFFVFISDKTENILFLHIAVIMVLWYSVYMFHRNKSGTPTMRKR